MTAARTLFSHMLVFLLLRNTWACSDFGSVAPMVLVSQTVSARVERSWLAQGALRTNFTHGILPMTRAGLPLEHAGRVTLRSHGPYDSSDSPARIRGIFSGVEFLRRAPQVSLCACECDIHHGNDMRPVRPPRPADMKSKLSAILREKGSALKRLQMGYVYFQSGRLHGPYKHEARRDNLARIIRQILRKASVQGFKVMHENELGIENKIGDATMSAISFGVEDADDMNKLVRGGAWDEKHYSSTYTFDLEQFDVAKDEAGTLFSLKEERISLCVCAAENITKTKLFVDKQWRLVRAPIAAARTAHTLHMQPLTNHSHMVPHVIIL